MVCLRGGVLYERTQVRYLEIRLSNVPRAYSARARNQETVNDGSRDRIFEDGLERNLYSENIPTPVLVSRTNVPLS